MNQLSKKIFSVILIVGMLISVSACTQKQDMNELTNVTEAAENQNKQEKEQTKQENIQKDNEVKNEEPKEEIKKKEIDYQKVKPYEVGNIMIIMYHGLVESNPPSPYQRTIEGFKKDLNYLYEHGYRLISMRNLIDNNIKVEAGYTPVILTFDDGISTSFSLSEENGELKPTPNCAVDIINNFAEVHPDFGKTATFYMNGDNDPFAGAGTFQQRVEYLINNGYEVGNHTYSHPKLNQLSGEEVQAQIGKVDQMIKEALPDYTVDSIAYPFGVRPKEELRDFVAQGEYKGKMYKYAAGLRVGPNGKIRVAPNHVTYDPLNLPRVRGSEGEDGDLWSFFQYYEKHPGYRYISDGDPNRISLPQQYEKNVNKETLGDKELYLYELQE